MIQKRVGALLYIEQPLERKCLYLSNHGRSFAIYGSVNIHVCWRTNSYCYKAHVTENMLLSYSLPWGSYCWRLARGVSYRLSDLLRWFDHGGRWYNDTCDSSKHGLEFLFYYAFWGSKYFRIERCQKYNWSLKNKNVDIYRSTQILTWNYDDHRDAIKIRYL